MMPLDSRSQGKLMFIAMLLAPAVAVQGVRLLADAELTPVAASTPQHPEVALPLPTKAPPLTPRQQAALAWVESASKIPSRSPLDQPVRAPRSDQPSDTRADDVQHAAPDAPAPAPVFVDDRPTHLKVSGMVGSDGDALAAISGKLRRVGDEPAKGWTITRIDSRHRTVVLKHSDGREFTISPPTPALQN